MTSFFLNSFLKSKIVLESFTTTKRYVTVPITVGVISIKMRYALYFLLALMVLDFITGIGASYSEHKKKKKENPELDLDILISSEKLKKSGVKFLLYATTIIAAYFLEQIFLLKAFEFGFSDGKFTISIIVIGFWSAVEIYSIVFENFKRMGFDVIERVKIIIRNYKASKDDL